MAPMAVELTSDLKATFLREIYVIRDCGSISYYFRDSVMRKYPDHDHDDFSYLSYGVEPDSVAIFADVKQLSDLEKQLTYYEHWQYSSNELVERLKRDYPSKLTRFFLWLFPRLRERWVDKHEGNILRTWEAKALQEILALRELLLSTRRFCNFFRVLFGIKSGQSAKVFCESWGNEEFSKKEYLAYDDDEAPDDDDDYWDNEDLDLEDEDYDPYDDPTYEESDEYRPNDEIDP